MDGKGGDAGAGGGVGVAGSSAAVPADVRRVEAALRSVGVREWDPRVVPALIEVYHRRMQDVLLLAQRLAEHANREVVEARDVEAALKIEPMLGKVTQTPLHVSGSSKATRAFRQVNDSALSLPGLPKMGARLPPAKDQLTEDTHRMA